MSTLAEIEKAAEALPPGEKQQLMLFLATRLCSEGAQMPEVREYARHQIKAWIEEDEADLRRFSDGA